MCSRRLVVRLPVGGELGRRHCDLFGDERQHLDRRCLVNVEGAARKAHTAQLDGEAEPIGSYPALGDQLDVGGAQRIVADDLAFV